MARTPKGFSSVANEYREAYEEGPEALRRFQAKERARSGDAALRKLNKREADRRANMPAPIEDRSVPIPKTVKKTKTATKAKFGVGSSKTIMHNGRSMANVTGDQLKKTGLKSTAAYMRRWKELGKRPTTATATPVKPTTTTTTTTVKPAVSSRGRNNARRRNITDGADGMGPTTSSSDQASQSRWARRRRARRAGLTSAADAGTAPAAGVNASAGDGIVAGRSRPKGEKPGDYWRRVEEYSRGEAERRRLETARLNKEYNDLQEARSSRGRNNARRRNITDGADGMGPTTSSSDQASQSRWARRRRARRAGLTSAADAGTAPAAGVNASAGDGIVAGRSRPKGEKPGDYWRRVEEYSRGEAERRRLETAILNKEYNDLQEARRGEAERRRLETASKRGTGYKGRNARNYAAGGAVKKSAAKKTSSKKSRIDGIARKGKTRAKHR